MQVLVLFVAATLFCLHAACSSRSDPPHLAVAAPPVSGGVLADTVPVVQGVADRDRDPAVFALSAADAPLCTATLIAPNVVLTSRHCVTRSVEHVVCPATSPQVSEDRDPSSLHLLQGDDAALAREVARGLKIVAPTGYALCDSDVALLVLDRDVPAVTPLAVRRHGIARGDHVRSVGYSGSATGQAGAKLYRDHVVVLDTTDFEFLVAETACDGDSGGPALDEATGEVVGVVSRGGPSCDGEHVHHVYTRVDAFYPLVQEALREGLALRGPPSAAGPDGGLAIPLDAGAKVRDAGVHAKPPPNDIGGACSDGADCASGVCVLDGSRQYCSRTCGTGDRCPTHYGCVKATSGAMVCVAK